MEQKDEELCDRASRLYPTISSEQAQILDELERGNHVVINAIPGAGKTKMILQIARAFPHRNISVVSFNTALVASTAAQLDELAYERSGWSTVHTYHGLIGALSQETVNDDILFREMLRFKNYTVLSEEFKNRDFDLFIIDEAQDMKPVFTLLVALAVKIVCTRQQQLQLVFLSDKRQTLYHFYPINKADHRYAQLAELIFGWLLDTVQEHRDWSYLSFTLSFRLTQQASTFLNVLDPSRTIQSANLERIRPENYVTLYIADVYKDAASIVTSIIRKEAGNKQQYQNILVLFESLRPHHGPARSVINALAIQKIPIHVAGSGGNRGKKRTHDDHDVHQNKVNIASFCSRKGCEADVTIVVSQSGLLSAFGELENSTFVALTRSKKRLYVIEHVYKTSQLDIDNLASHPTIDQSVLRVIIKRPVPLRQIVKNPREEEKDASSKKMNDLISIDTLFSFLDEEHLENLLKHIEHSVYEFPTITTDNDDTNNEHQVEPADDDYDAYLASLVVSQNDGKTYHDFRSCVNQALQMALEFYFTRKTPRKFCDVFSKISGGFAEDATQSLMYSHGLHALDKIADGNPKDPTLEQWKQHVSNHLAEFAKFGVVSNAYFNFCDVLFQTENFHFMQNPQIGERLGKLIEIVRRLFVAFCENQQQQQSQYTVDDIKQLEWSKQTSMLFTDDMENTHMFEMIGSIDIASPNGAFVVHFAHDIDISHEERLQTIANALINRKDSSLPLHHVYVVNMITLRVEKLDIVSDTTQPITTPPEITAPKLVRRMPCIFLNEALTYKYWNQASLTEENSDDAFVAKTKRDIRDLLITQGVDI